MDANETTTALCGVVSTIDLFAEEDDQGAVEIAATVTAAVTATATATVTPTVKAAQGPDDLADQPVHSALSDDGAVSPGVLSATGHDGAECGVQVDYRATPAVAQDVSALAPAPHAVAVLVQPESGVTDNAGDEGPLARVVESGTEVVNLLDGNDEGDAIEMGDASAVAAPPPVSARAVTGKFDIEPGAISIPPEVLAIEHPAGPHAVLVVDTEPRRSRERYPSELPPEPRPPLIVELAGDAQLFGRTISSLCTAFDRYSSGMHGAFQKEEGTGVWHVRDMSDKGLKLNGRYIDRGDLRKLNDGAVLTFGLWSKIVFFQGHDGSLTPTEI
jgi:hypothetical protein